MATNSSGFTFEHEISAGGRLYGMHVHKVPAPRYGVSIYDFFIVWKGMPVAVECKATRDETSFPFDRVKSWQVEAMLEMHNSGGKAYVLINVRRGRTQVAYILSILEYVRLRDFYATMGRKSIPLLVMKGFPQLSRLSKPAGWDIRCLFSEETYNEAISTTVNTSNAPSSGKPCRRTKVSINKGAEDKDI